MTKMTRDEAEMMLVFQPQRRFHVLFPNEPDMAMNGIGQRVSMRGITPVYGIDQAFEIAEKFGGEVA